MKKEKKVIQRNLSLADRYKFVSAAYKSLEDGGWVCENCGKLISNLVTVKNQNDKKFIIGTDCADTLTNLEKDWDYLQGINSFAEGKRIRAKINNHFKKNNIEGVYIYTSKDGKEQFAVYEIRRGGTAMEKLLYPDITIPYIKDLLNETITKETLK